jgi:hypothetical protein
MRSSAVWVLITSVGFASSVEAQSAISTFPSRFSFGGDVVISQPKSEFATNVKNGYGIDLTGMFAVDPRGVFNLRADFGGIQYGRETKRIPSFVTGRVRYDLETDNRIAFGSFGVQLQSPDGWFRPYANAAIAVTNFYTESSLSSHDDSFEPISNTNHSDASHAWIFGGGLKIPFGKYSAGAINLGARYFYGGRATYLTKGDIVDNPDGSVTLNTRESKTDLVLWQIGASFTIPRSTGR